MKNHIPSFEDFVNEAVQYKTLEDPKIKAADIHKWLVRVSYNVGRNFPASRAKTKEEKAAIVMNPEFQAAYELYHQQYFDSLIQQWKGVCSKHLPMRGITKETSKAELEDMFNALEEWITRENGILDAIKEIGFESFAANEIMGHFHKKPMKLKRVY
jgi:hypothetical protein